MTTEQIPTGEPFETVSPAAPAPATIDAETARAAIVFLGRVDLKGAETPTFAAVVGAIRQFVPPPEQV